MPLNSKRLKAHINKGCLDLSNSNIKDEDVQLIFQYLSDNPKIKSLNLSYNKISYKGTKILSCNTSLTSLNLHSNLICNEGASAISRHKRLRSLDLGDNKIGSKGARVLAYNTTLISLNLAGNKISDKGAIALSHNTTLKTLNMKLNEIESDYKKAIEYMRKRHKARKHKIIDDAKSIRKAKSVDSATTRTHPLEQLTEEVRLINDHALGEKRSYGTFFYNADNKENTKPKTTHFSRKLTHKS
jgi:Leucine-rich repeat (LRR) protein